MLQIRSTDAFHGKARLDHSQLRQGRHASFVPHASRQSPECAHLTLRERDAEWELLLLTCLLKLAFKVAVDKCSLSVFSTEIPKQLKQSTLQVETFGKGSPAEGAAAKAAAGSDSAGTRG